MNSVKALHKRIDKLETVFLFNSEKLFYETLSDDDITKLIHCFTKEELKDIQEIQDKEEMNDFIERKYNTYKELMKHIFVNEQELFNYKDEINFYVKYSLSLSKSDQSRLRDPNSKVSNRFIELLLNRRRKKRGFTNGEHQYSN